MSWDDEDFDFDELVPDSLKAKEESTPEPAAAPAPTEGLRGKAQAKARAKMLAEREAAEAEAAARRRAMMEESTGDDAVDRRRRHEMQVRADLEAAEDAFGDDAGSADEEELKEDDVADVLERLTLNKPSKFEEFATAVAKRVEGAGSRPDTMVFLRKLLSEITGDLRADDVKELSKMLDIERNRKVDAERAARGGGKKKKAKAKPKVNASKGSDAWDEYSDFM